MATKRRRSSSNYIGSVKAGFERAKSMRTIGVAAGFVAAKPINAGIIKAAPKFFGTDGGNPNKLFTKERFARTGLKVALASVFGAIAVASKNDIAVGVGTGGAAGELLSIVRDYGLEA